MKGMRSNRFDALVGFVVFLVVAIIIVGAIAAGMAIFPRYGVWQQRLAGEAELSRAEFNRQIAVREAEAVKEAATLLAVAEVERAKGVAEANAIIGDSLKGNSDYIRYLWVQSLNAGGHQLVYIPTEANLPITEATRMAPPVTVEITESED